MLPLDTVSESEQRVYRSHTCDNDRVTEPSTVSPPASLGFAVCVFETQEAHNTMPLSAGVR